MSVLQKESPQKIIQEALDRMVAQAKEVNEKAYAKTQLFEELTESIRRSSILRATSRFIVGKHIEKPFLNGITAKGHYEEVLDIVDASQRAYLDAIQGLIAGGKPDAARKMLESILLFKPTVGGMAVLLAEVRMPDLTKLELSGVKQSQEAAFFRMGSEVDERVIEQYRGTHG